MTTIYVEHIDRDEPVIYTEQQVTEFFNDMLDSSSSLIMLGGIGYEYSRVWEATDPVAYRQAFLDYTDNYEEFEVPWEFLLMDDDDYQLKKFLNERFDLGFDLGEND